MEKMNARPVRNRKTSRKSWSHHGDCQRPIKRLFTPEIKRLLKDWLVRRRDNPYPSRDEKKQLAVETGLTYTQICNWFANWRRKLKNTSNMKKSWGHLIKNYNFSAKGNVEQFSISSGDSIWGEEIDCDSLDSVSPQITNQNSEFEATHYYTTANYPYNNNNQKQLISASDTVQNYLVPATGQLIQNNSQQIQSGYLAQAQCFQVSSTTGELQLPRQLALKQLPEMCHRPPQTDKNPNFGFFSNSNKFKNHIMEKYLRGLDESNNNINENICNTIGIPKKPELSKWLESTANFQPSKNNYNIGCWEGGSVNGNIMTKYKGDKIVKPNGMDQIHEKELIAAEALELLANNFRTKFYNS